MNPKITPELAEICGIHAGDGYLRNDGHRREWDISGSYDEKDYYDSNVIPLFNSVFNLKIKGRFFPHRSTYGFVIRDRKVIEFAHNVLKFPYGSKSLIVKAPDFIINNPLLISHFLRGYFDTDGSFGCQNKSSGKYSSFKRTYHYYPKVCFSTVSNLLSSDLARLLNLFNFKFFFYKSISKKSTENMKYRYDLNGNLQVNKFMDLIKPRNSTKTTRYNIWKKFGFCPTKISYNQRINILKGILDPYSFYDGPVA